MSTLWGWVDLNFVDTKGVVVPGGVLVRHVAYHSGSMAFVPNVTLREADNGRWDLVPNHEWTLQEKS